MAITDKKACWYCLRKTMVLCPELGVEWFKCSECGATWIKVPKPVLPALTAESYVTETGRHFVPRPISKKKKVKA